MPAKVKPANHRIIAVNPGGGLKGVFQSGVWAGAEAYLGGSLSGYVDLAVSSSVGSFTSIAMGLDVPQATVQSTIADNAEAYFTKNYLRRLANLYWRSGLYDYRRVLKDLTALGADVTLGDLKVPTIITAACRNDKRTHYFKSYDPKDSPRKILDVASFAYAAPWYFGARNSPAERRTYFDAGVGTQNNPIVTAMHELVLKGWHKTGTVSVLLVGTGYDDTETPYEVTSKEGLCGQLKNSIRFASDQSDGMNNTVALFIDELLENTEFNIVNFKLPAGHDAMDHVEDVPLYKQVAADMVKTLDFGKLLGVPA